MPGACSAGGAWNGKIVCDFSGIGMSLESVKWFMKISLPLAGRIYELDYSYNKLDGNALLIASTQTLETFHQGQLPFVEQRTLHYGRPPTKQHHPTP